MATAKIKSLIALPEQAEEFGFKNDIRIVKVGKKEYASINKPSINDAILIPLQTGTEKDPKSLTGCTVEELLFAAYLRIVMLNQGEWECDENLKTLGHITRAIKALNRRTARRIEEGTEGTMQP